MEKKSKKSLSCRKVFIRHLRIFVSIGTVNEREKIRRSRSPRRTGEFRDDRPLCYNGMQAFTLIELLVVVLIIGILAAVAVPQYTLAVDKAKLSNLMSIMQSLKDAQERYYLANNVYATTIDELDIDVPANAEYTLNFSSAPQGIYGKYNNLKNIILTAAQNHATGAGSEYKGMWICYAKKTDARANKLCQYLAKTKNNGWSAETGQGPSYAYGFSR